MQTAHHTRFKLLDKHLVDAVFSRMVHLNIHPGLVKTTAQISVGFLNNLGRILESVLCDMRSYYEFLKPPLLHAAYELNRNAPRLANRHLFPAQHDCEYRL